MPTPRKIGELLGVSVDTSTPARGKVAPCSVRPAPEELKQWKAVAANQAISLHSLLLYLIRRGMREIMRGQLTVPRETITIQRVKMP